jgi:hypothetical protein
MERKTYRINGLTKEQLNATYPVRLCFGKKYEREITVLRRRKDDAMAFVRLNWLERVYFEIQKIHSLIKNQECNLSLRRI